MKRELEWRRTGANRWEAKEEAMRYIVRRQVKDGNERWFVKMNGVAIGAKGGWGSFAAVTEYVNWGGTPNRMGYDRETGEVHD